VTDIFLFSGLGADERVFDFIDLSPFHVSYVRWIKPKLNESIESYANRLSQQITSTNAVLIGVSFGGIMAIEVGKIIETKKIIIISSAKSKSDIPVLYRLLGLLKLNRLIPDTLLLKTNALTAWLFGAKTTGERNLLRQIIHDTDLELLKWAIDRIVNWKNTQPPDNVTTIHGTNDRILPRKAADYLIEGGGHLMIVSKANEVQSLIMKILAT
jgi:esterase/lipase